MQWATVQGCLCRLWSADSDKRSPIQDRRRYLIDAGSFSQVDGLPAIDKGSQGEIHVFYRGSAFPSAHSHNGLATPDASCSIEVEEATSSKLDILLALAVEVQGNLLSLRYNTNRLSDLSSSDTNSSAYQ